MRRFLILLGLCFAVAGCSNAAKIADVPADEGALRTFAAPLDAVQRVAISSLQEMGMRIQQVEDGPQSIVILFTRPTSFTNYGGVGRVTLERGSPVAVRLVYEKRVGPNMAGYDSVFARNYYAKFYPALGLEPPPKNPG